MTCSAISASVSWASAISVGDFIASANCSREKSNSGRLSVLKIRRPGFFSSFYKICITVVAPLVMAFVLAGQMIGFFTNVDGSNGSSVSLVCYIVSAVILVLGYVYAAIGSKKETHV